MWRCFFMKLLCVKAANFKNCADNFTIDFVAKSKKTSEDKEYELQEIAEELFVYSTAAFVGKNASGKTTAIELLECCYSILSDFYVDNKKYLYTGIHLEIYFYHEGYIYKYITDLQSSSTFSTKANFVNQHLFVKKYYKSKAASLYSEYGFTEFCVTNELPEDTSIVFFVLKKKETKAIYFNCDGKGVDTYQLLFQTLNKYKISNTVLTKVLKLFDENISSLTMIDEHNYKLVSHHTSRILSDKELMYMLSSGTTKGMLLYMFVVASLQNGFDLLVDEIENHFHKTLVENMISLYKDKSVNKNNATLMFTTHYCELLDLFNRQDNIWICKANDKIELINMYEGFDIRPELIKSKQFYNDAFKTSVNYEDLMDLKKELMS